MFHVGVKIYPIFGENTPDNNATGTFAAFKYHPDNPIDFPFPARVSFKKLTAFHVCIESFPSFKQMLNLG
jgi:hypothetical protein